MEGLHRETVCLKPSFFPTFTQVAKGRPWYIQPSCAMTGDGLVEGLDWLSEKLKVRWPCTLLPLLFSFLLSLLASLHFPTLSSSSPHIHSHFPLSLPNAPFSPLTGGRLAHTPWYSAGRHHPPCCGTKTSRRLIQCTGRRGLVGREKGRDGDVGVMADCIG